MSATSILKILILAVIPHLVVLQSILIWISRYISHCLPIISLLAEILSIMIAQVGILAHQTSIVSYQMLLILPTWHTSLLKVDYSFSTFERVPAQAVRLVWSLMSSRVTCKLYLRHVGILRVYVLVSSSIDRCKSLGCDECATLTFGVAHAHPLIVLRVSNIWVYSHSNIRLVIRHLVCGSSFVFLHVSCAMLINTWSSLSIENFGWAKLLKSTWFLLVLQRIIIQLSQWVLFCIWSLTSERSNLRPRILIWVVTICIGVLLKLQPSLNRALSMESSSRVVHLTRSSHVLLHHRRIHIIYFQYLDVFLVGSLHFLWCIDWIHATFCIIVGLSGGRMRYCQAMSTVAFSSTTSLGSPADSRDVSILLVR